MGSRATATTAASTDLERRIGLCPDQFGGGTGHCGPPLGLWLGSGGGREAAGTERARVDRRFIARHRDTRDPDRLIEVGSAIRKFVAELPADSLNEVADIIDGTTSEAVE